MATELGARRDAGLPPAELSWGGYAWVTVAATGGPLALAAAYVPSVLGDAHGSAGLVAVLGAALFVPSVVVWRRYCVDTADAGGLYSFVAAAAGPRLAGVQAAFWLVSYVLYLVYTATYVAYDLIPAVFPGAGVPSALLQMLVAAGVAAVALLPLGRAVLVLAASAAAQLGAVLALALVGAARLGLAAGSLDPPQPRTEVLVPAGSTALLFVCASLPLFLAGETRGGGGSVRRGLASGWAVAATAVALAVVPLAAAGPSALGADVPGVALLREAGAPGLAAVVGVGVAVSVSSLMVVELLALSRLTHVLAGQPVRRVSWALAGVLVAGSAASLLDPLRVYADLLKPSLVALWLAQLVVFAAYPWHAARRGRLGTGDVLLSAASSALMLFGLYSTVVNQLAS